MTAGASCGEVMGPLGGFVPCSAPIRLADEAHFRSRLDIRFAGSL